MDSNKLRIGIIGAALIIIASSVLYMIWGNITPRAVMSSSSIPEEVPYINAEGDAFKNLDMLYFENHFAKQKGKVRTLNEYYSRRAFSGAPPYIPHEVKTTMNLKFSSCLSCHENGGFSKELNAYAPVTPHPEFKNCRQCHVPMNDKNTFKGSHFTGLEAPKIGNKALLTSPPVIPHQLQLRENCAACHSGPSAPVEIRTTHPERINCRQCHVPQLTRENFSK